MSDISPKFNYDIEVTDFENYLNQNQELTVEDKQNLKSIFSEISQDDILQQEEWENFSNPYNYQANTNPILNRLQLLKNYTLKEIEKFKNIMSDFLNQTMGKVTYVHPTENPNRANNRSEGTFDGNWISQDGKGSKTYKEWLKNNNYVYDQEIVKKILAEAPKHFSSIIPANDGNCSKCVTDTLSSIYIPQEKVTGIKSEKWTNLSNHVERQESAYKNASYFVNNPNFKELPNNIVANMDLKKDLPAGCIIIYDAGYKDDGKLHENGHIGITDGHGNDLSYITAKIVTAHQKNRIRVFVPIVPNVEQA